MEWQHEEDEQTEDDKNEESSENLNAERSERDMDSKQQDDEAVPPAGEAMRIGPGRPRIILTGKSGRPRKEYNVVNAMIKAEIPLPQAVKKRYIASKLLFGRKP